MSTPITGGCACKSIRLAYDGVPVLSYKCHCHDCQISSGGGGVGLIWVWADRLTVTAGTPRYHRTVASSGRPVERGFCDRCGTPVLAKFAIPGIAGVFASSLDDPAAFEPRYEIWTSSARPWDPLDPGLEHFEENFSTEVVLAHLKP